MTSLIEIVRHADINEVVSGWQHIREKNDTHFFNVDVNSIIRMLVKSSLIKAEMGYLFYLASNPRSRAAAPGAVSLSAHDINKIVKHIWREQNRLYREVMRSGCFDDGIPF